MQANHLDLINKRKIINDPVYGFINIQTDLLFDLIEHPFFQRLRRIKQLGLTHLVYPGALHTRFHHSLGAMHLMMEALQVLKSKGHKISEKETEGALIAILLHDIGHGPFSHALEHSIIKGVQHETISEVMMNKLNQQFNGALETGLAIFRHQHPKHYLSHLVSSQLDMDRLDYLTRDSFFTGVSEGVIGTQRIIKMLNIADDKLVAEVKGIHSIEKFIIARRIMYWQVYLHKTVLAAENILIKILARAKKLTKSGDTLFATPSLQYFLQHDVSRDELIQNEEVLIKFSNLDDFDILSAIKVWMDHPDPILSWLCKAMIHRRLFRCEIQTEPFDYFFLEDIKDKIYKQFEIDEEDLTYFLVSDTTSNYAYKQGHEEIEILLKNGKVVDMLDASDQFDTGILSKQTTKHFICYPKEILY